MAETDRGAAAKSGRVHGRDPWRHDPAELLACPMRLANPAAADFRSKESLHVVWRGWFKCKLIPARRGPLCWARYITKNRACMFDVGASAPGLGSRSIAEKFKHTRKEHRCVLREIAPAGWQPRAPSRCRCSRHASRLCPPAADRTMPHGRRRRIGRQLDGRRRSAMANPVITIPRRADPLQSERSRETGGDRLVACRAAARNRVVVR